MKYQIINNTKGAHPVFNYLEEWAINFNQVPLEGYTDSPESMLTTMQHIADEFFTSNPSEKKPEAFSFSLSEGKDQSVRIQSLINSIILIPMQ